MNYYLYTAIGRHFLSVEHSTTLEDTRNQSRVIGTVYASIMVQWNPYRDNEHQLLCVVAHCLKLCILQTVKG